MAEVRQRKSPRKSTDEDTSPTLSAFALAKEEDRPRLTLLEILRTITLLLLLSGLVSWFITRDNVFFGANRPKALHISYWKSLIASPVSLNDTELRAYDGSDPTKPIYLAVNGSIYDVTPGARFYGPGGSYHFFAGADGSRAFVTSCFESDINPDLRGVEEMFMPTSTPEIDALFTTAELAVRLEQERRHAGEAAYKALKHWVDFFENSPKYAKVGRVKREKGWESKGEKPELCQKAKDSRPVRRPPVREKEEL